MNNTILLGKLLYTKLKENTDIAKSVGTKIFPIVAENGTTFPFIVYKRDSISSNGCKDGYWFDNVTFEVVVVGDKYFETANIANQVRKVLNVGRLQCEDLRINDIQLISATEDFNNEAFVQTLQFAGQVY